MATQILEKCRTCSGIKFVERVNLGEQYFSGYFPKKNEDISNLKAPLTVIECLDCNLVQLKNTFNLELMYGDNYGYRSGLNPVMVSHLNSKAESLIQKYGINVRSRILDIGANDGTFLRNFNNKSKDLYGIDPTIEKWDEYYDFDVNKIPIIFSTENIKNLDLGQFDLITCISMFYDLLDPVNFTKSIKSILKPHGILHIELSYLPTMLESKSYDTICHEHLEYYSLKSLNQIFERSEMKIIDYSLNNVNGGSIALNVTHSDSKTFSEKIDIKKEIRIEESRIDEFSWVQFRESVRMSTSNLKLCIQEIMESGKSVYGLGASTKGNVILQASNLNFNQIKAIGEVNEQKVGRVTPGTEIPIDSELDIDRQKPDYKIILPWHFKEHFIRSQSEFLESGGKLIFPLPLLEIISL